MYSIQLAGLAYEDSESEDDETDEVRDSVLVVIQEETYPGHWLIAAVVEGHWLIAMFKDIDYLIDCDWRTLSDWLIAMMKDIYWLIAMLKDIVPREDPLWQLYLAVRNFTTPTGTELAEAFLSLPSRWEIDREIS